MPGFGLLYQRTGFGPSAGNAVATALKRTCRGEGDQLHLTAGESFQLGWTAYGGYPVAQWITPISTLLVEGMLYDRPAKALRQRLQPSSSESPSLEEAARILREFIDASDGDFAVVFLPRASTGGVLVGVDSLGRLPVYWARQGTEFCVGRDIRFIRALMPGRQPDRLGIAEALVMGFPLETRTLVEGVHRLPPGGLIQFDGGSEDPVNLTETHWDFSPVTQTEHGPKTTARILAEEFIAGCHRRARALPVHRAVISLSGGLDSRAVASACQQASVGGVARTFTVPRGRPGEAAIAQRIASQLQIPWSKTVLLEPSLEDADSLIRMKSGLNSGAMSYAGAYLRTLTGEPGTWPALWTGEGGDVVLPPRHPHRHVRGVSELAALLLRRGSLFPEPDVCEITGLEAGSVTRSLQTVLASYPESEMPGRFLHFYISGYEHKVYFEGEDRNRAYLWTLAPFYARPFFDQAIRLPFAWKRYRRFQTLFLRALDPVMTRIPNANNGLNPGSVLDAMRQHFRDFVLGWGPAESALLAFRSSRRKHSDGGHLRDRLLAVAQESRTVALFMEKTRMKAALANPVSLQSLWAFYTIVRFLASFDSEF